MKKLNVGPADFDPALIIFDKDGTLIDFDAMWGDWVTELARRLERATGRPLAERLFHDMGYDAASGRALADGPLAVTPMAILYSATVDTLRGAGLSREAAQAAVASSWLVPDPATLAKPCADLKILFRQMVERGIKIAVATSDDRAPTEATLRGLGVESFIEALACADDGAPVKPAPDMVYTICRQLAIDCAHAVVVGDSVADMQMGRSAGAGLVVGVLSGVSAAQTLAPHADVIVPSIADLVAVETAE